MFMGAWNYYIEIKADKQILDDMLSSYEQNKAYQTAFNFAKKDGSCLNGYNAGIEAVIDNFLPANHLIYKFLAPYVSCNLCIKTNEIERAYDFTQKADFIKFMYDAWEQNIDSAYERLGTMVVNHKRYYKLRNRLYKKYFIKIPCLTDNED